jgi:hypothetical protein
MFLSACPAANHTGVLIADDGLPRVINCGTWIAAVSVKDADSSRVVWEAHARTPGSAATVGSVSLGALPSRRWVEDAALAVEPRPARWRFDVDALPSVTILVTDTEFEIGRVYRPGNQVEPLSRFDEQTCSGVPISNKAFRILFGAFVVMAAGVGVAGWLRDRLRRA